jgi:predicted permease
MALNAFLPEGMLETLPGYTGIDTALSMLAGLTIPLILVIIGYQLRFRLSGFASPLALLASRTILLLGFAVLMDRLVFPRLGDVPELLAPAMYTLAILPPPFIMPLFMDGASEEEAEFVGTTLSLGTLVTLALFFVILVLSGA